MASNDNEDIHWEELIEEELINRLILYTIRRLKNMKWRHNREAEDFIHDAIVKTMDGIRKWNPNVSLVRHLMMVIKSDTNHAAV